MNKDEKSILTSTIASGRPQQDFDAAGHSLSEALKVSFMVLKVIMIVLVVIFVASGFKSVASDQRAILLRFGKIHGVGEQRVLSPGLHWVFPYPIDHLIRIPVAKKVNLPINVFWYYQSPEELQLQGPAPNIRVSPTLKPIIDGYCITRGQSDADVPTGAKGDDYNIVHNKWQLIYVIDDPERFFKNVYVEDVKPGQDYFSIVTTGVKPLLEDLTADSVVTAMVHYTIDEALSSQDRISLHVKRLLQQKLDQIEAGISVVSVQLTDMTWPRQVADAFQASIIASQASQQAVSESRLYAEKTLNEAGGPAAEELLAAINNPAVTAGEREQLWSQLAGAAQETIAQAKAYRTRMVETAKANSEYLLTILPEYRQRPELVVQELYRNAIESILNNVDEKMIIDPSSGKGGREVRVLLNKDPLIKPKDQEQQ